MRWNKTLGEVQNKLRLDYSFILYIEPCELTTTIVRMVTTRYCPPVFRVSTVTFVRAAVLPCHVSVKFDSCLIVRSVSSCRSIIKCLLRQLPRSLGGVG